jgi:small-conductance mechanosensitive channel
MAHAVDPLIAAVVRWGPRLAAGAGAFLAFWVVSVILRSAIGRLGARLDADLVVLAQRVAAAGALVVGTVTALGTMGVDVSAMVAGLGLTGFALGFALKDVLSNVLSGTLILFYRPFRRHDRIQVAGFEGRVADIDLRYTTLDGEDRRILIPNATLITNAITVMKAEPPEAP